MHLGIWRALEKLKLLTLLSYSPNSRVHLLPFHPYRWKEAQGDIFPFFYIFRVNSRAKRCNLLTFLLCFRASSLRDTGSHQRTGRRTSPSSLFAVRGNENQANIKKTAYHIIWCNSRFCRNANKGKRYNNCRHESFVWEIFEILGNALRGCPLFENSRKCCSIRNYKCPEIPNSLWFLSAPDPIAYNPNSSLIPRFWSLISMIHIIPSHCPIIYFILCSMK